MKESPPPVVLVPPRFDGSYLASAKSRMAKSSYDVLFSKIARECLFENYYRDAGHLMTRIMLKPSEDPNVDFIATISTPLDEDIRKVEGRLEGDAEFRWQSGAKDQDTFVELKMSTSKNALEVQTCTFRPSTGIGAFSNLPLSSKISPTAKDPHSIGFRYGASNLSIGTTIDPFFKGPLTFWLVGRLGKITAGCQYKPLAFEEFEGHWVNYHSASIQNLKNWSFAVDFGSGRNSPLNPNFSFCVEVNSYSKLIASYYHHLIVQRQVRNLFEEDRVVAITNYIDLGFEFQQSLGEKKEALDDELPAMQIGASWQANKNLFFKAKLGILSSGVALIFKSWWQPSFTISCAVVRDHMQKQTKFGMGLQVENFGGARYERADPNYVMFTPTKEHIAEGLLKNIKQRPILETDINSGNFEAIPSELCPSDSIL